MNEGYKVGEQITGPLTLVHVGERAEGPPLPQPTKVEQPVRHRKLYRKLAPVILATSLLAACISLERPPATNTPPAVPALSQDTDARIGEEVIFDRPEAVETVAVATPSFNFDGVMTSDSSLAVIDVDEVGVMQQVYPEFLYDPASVQSADTPFEHVQVLNMLDVEVDFGKILALRDTYRGYIANNPVLEFGGERLTLKTRQKRIYGLYIVPDTVPVPGIFGIDEGFEPPALTTEGDNGYISILRFGQKTFSDEMTNDPLVDLELSLLIETCQSIAEVRVSDPTLDMLWQETFCNSVGRGMLAAMGGLDYDMYSQWIRATDYILPGGDSIYLHPISETLYNEFSQLSHDSIFKIPALP